MMIKKATLIVLLCALVLGAGVYYFDWKKDSEKKPDADASKLAFSLQAADIVSFTVSHPVQPADMPMRFEKHDGDWRIAQPVATEADQPTVAGLVDQLADDRVAQTEPGSADRRKAFGLDPPQISIDFQLANGAKHSVQLGNPDFTNEYVYAVLDGGQSVSLLPQVLSTSAGKSLDDMRDRTVLHLSTDQATAIDLKNSAGNLALSKEKDQWKFANPAGALAGSDAVDSLLQAVSNARMVSVASETPDKLAQDGLANPSLTLTVTVAKGAKDTLIVGKKDGNAYFARDLSRPTIFRVDADLESKLAQKFSDLRDKQVLHAEMTGIQRIQIQDASGSIALTRKPGSTDDWIFDSPADRKGKPVASWKIVDPLGTTQADEVIDRPTPAQLAQLINPALRIILTGKDGKDVTLRISKPAGDFAYVRTDGDAALYKVKKSVFDQLNVSAADLAAGDSVPN
jgi:Domain of unknown function (DUF4340)